MQIAEAAVGKGRCSCSRRKSRSGRSRSGRSSSSSTGFFWGLAGGRNEHHDAVVGNGDTQLSRGAGKVECPVSRRGGSGDPDRTEGRTPSAGVRPFCCYRFLGPPCGALPLGRFRATAARTFGRLSALTFLPRALAALTLRAAALTRFLRASRHDGLPCAAQRSLPRRPMPRSTWRCHRLRRGCGALAVSATTRAGAAQRASNRFRRPRQRVPGSVPRRSSAISRSFTVLCQFLAAPPAEAACRPR